MSLQQEIIEALGVKPTIDADHEVRVSVGVERYTGNFTPPTAPFSA